MKYYSYVEDFSLDSLALGYSPKPGMGNATTVFWFHLTGESGRTYNFIRALGIPSKDVSLNFGLYEGNDDIDERSKLLIAQSEHPVVEPFWMARRADAVVYGGASFEIAMYEDRYEWREAGDRVQLTAERLGDPVTVWIPPQPALENGFVDRSHMGRVSGTIDGDPVDGFFADDHLYSRPGIEYPETEVVAKIENFWVQWLVEFEDGSVEGGTAWRGQPGTGFAHAHHYVGGRSLARQDGRIEITRNSQGSIEHSSVTFSDVRFDFDHVGAFDWPLHFYGNVTTSRDLRVVKSWQWLENWPTNMAAVEQFQDAYQRLYGRPCSLRKVLAGARIENEALVLAPADSAVR